MSVLIKGVLDDIQSIFQLNAAVAIAVIDVLKTHAIPNLSVKWPNDIMSGNKKIGGILIENSIKSNGKIDSIVGLGLNVNQTNFENLQQASSLALVSGKTFDKDILLVDIAKAIQTKSAELPTTWDDYVNQLFKKGIPMAFEKDGRRFMGIIVDVETDGKLRLHLEDDSFATFGIKEIQMLY
jgi:BirA family biotin operon repressor/biotin-[acetyl-CoA-carboxylase] ligase